MPPSIRHAGCAVLEEGEMLKARCYQAQRGWQGAEPTVRLSPLGAGRAGDGEAALSTPGVGSPSY